MYLTQGINRAAQIKPNGIATICGDRRRSWRDTVARILRIAGGLRRRGFGKGDRAAILALNSDRYFEFLFAVPAAGGVVVPVNTRLAVPEISYLLADSGASMLFIDSNFAPVLVQLQGKMGSVRTVVWLDDEALPDGMVAFEALLDVDAITEVAAENDDIAGIFYTGGTTGQSKGVMLSHRNLVANAANMIAAVGYGGDSIYLHAAPMFHIADNAPALAVTMFGGTHVFIPRFDPAAVAAAVAAEHVTTTLLVPTMINALANFPGLDQYDMSSLTKVPFGASPMPVAVLRRAIETLPGCAFYHLYGMTEAAPLVTAAEAGDAMHPTLSKSCGKVALLVEVRIADGNDTEVPRGTPGEVQVRGPNIMLGYWNKPDATAAALRGGWYHSGDGGIMDEEGHVFIVDRLKDMIVTGGENVYSAEVENVIATMDGVAEVAVIGIPDERWGEAVHAIVVPRAGQTVTEERVLAHCRGLIGGFKCPRRVDIRDTPLPLSGAGKVLKTELRKPFWEGREKQVN